VFAGTAGPSNTRPTLAGPGATLAGPIPPGTGAATVKDGVPVASRRASGMPGADEPSPDVTGGGASGASTCAVCPVPAPAAGATVRATVEVGALWLSLLSPWPGIAAGGVGDAASSWADAVPAGSAAERCRPPPAAADALGPFAARVDAPGEGAGGARGGDIEGGSVGRIDGGAKAPEGGGDAGDASGRSTVSVARPTASATAGMRAITAGASAALGAASDGEAAGSTGAASR